MLSTLLRQRQYSSVTWFPELPGILGFLISRSGKRIEFAEKLQNLEEEKT